MGKQGLGVVSSYYWHKKKKWDSFIMLAFLIRRWQESSCCWLILPIWNYYQCLRKLVVYVVHTSILYYSILFLVHSTIVVCISKTRTCFFHSLHGFILIWRSRHYVWSKHHALAGWWSGIRCTLLYIHCICYIHRDLHFNGMKQQKKNPAAF